MKIKYKYVSTISKVLFIALTISATLSLSAQITPAQGKPGQVSATPAGGDQKPFKDSQVSNAALYEPQDIFDAFAPNAVTLQDMELRAKHHPYMPGEIVVAMELGTSKSNAASVLDQFNWQGLFAQQGVELSSVLMKADRGSFRSIALVLLSLPEGIEVFEAMKKLEGKSGVLWTSPNFYFEGDPREFIPNDPGYASQYHHPLMKNDLAWDITLGSPSIIIAITDDGVELTHSDLAPNIWVNTGEIPGNGIDDDGNGYIDDVYGWNFANGNNNPNPNQPSHNHGTHVAGIAAARTNNAIGVAGVSGHSTIMPLQFYDYITWTAAMINETFTYAADNGANIVNTSYNIDFWVGDPVFTAGLQYLYDAGVLHLNSAGNNNQLNPPRQAFQQTLLVASTDNLDVRSGFSNYGVGIDISAPGSSIYATVTGNSYNYLSGTSMAAPNAAGAAALIWSANPSWTRDQVAAQLIATADNIDAANPTLVGLLGSGRVNSYAALTSVLAAPQVKSTIGLPDEGTIISPIDLTNFSVAFDQVMNPASVNNLANFELRNAGPNEIFGDGDDLVHPLTTTTTYQIGTNQLTFQISDLPLQCGLHRLKLVSGGLENPFGTDLDGDGNGVGGDDFVRNFSVLGVLSYFDGDGDGYGAGSPSTACPPPPGYVLLDGDCDDNNPLINPGATEICDGVDNNCDGIVDFPPVETYVSTDVPVAISASGTPTVFSTITISGATGNIIDLNVKDLNILHTWVGDLKVTLTSPGGTVLVLFDRPGYPATTFGCEQNNIFTTFDDEASLTAVDFENTCNSSPGTTPPYTYAISGIYQPIDALSALNGTSPDGTWTLTVSDFFDGDGGSIEGWGMEIISVPGIIFVDAGATGLNNGSSWTDAFTDLQDALNSTCPGITEIWVAAGTYYPTSGIDRNISFVMKNNLAIYGGFEGTEDPLTFDLANRDFVANETILSGDIGTLSDNSDNSYTVVTGSGTDATAVIDGFTITGGNSNDVSSLPTSTGGGMFNSNGSPTVTNCTFTWNSAISTGGAFFIENGNSILRNNTFISNHADFSGGAIRYEGGEHIAINNLFAHNTTNLFGSVIGTATTDYTLINNTFVNNEASDIGTVVYNFSSNVYLVNNIFWGNTKGGETDVPDADLINDNGIVNRFEYSLLQANSAFSGNAGNITNVDPLFIDQPPVGLYTGGDLRLQACSPAINAGSNAAVPAGIITDLDGNPRFYDNGTVDMGAYEYQGEKNVNPPPIAIISGIIDDFEIASLPNGTDPFGNGIGFITFGDFGAGTTVDIATTLVADTDPLAMPGQSGDNYLLRFEANVNDFGGLTHAFENEDVNTWVTQDWSGYQGIAFWLYGQNTGNSLYFEIQDNRNPGSTVFDVELWTYAFTDDFSGWKLFALNFDDFTRKEIGNGAPNDGFGRNEVHGWVFGALNTGGATVTYYLDNVMVYGDGGPFCPYTTINFSAPAGMATYAWSLSVISGDAAIGSWDNNIFTPGTANGQDVQVVGVCATVFTLTLIVTDAQGCSVSAQNTFVVEEAGLEWVNEPQDYSISFNVADLEAEVQNWLNSMEASSSCSTVNAGYYLPLLQVNSPGDIQEYYISGRANFGLSEFNVTGDLEMADPALACDPLLDDLTNKIAIIDRGTCTFTSKVKNAQDAGAIAAIVINSNPEQGVITMGGTDPTITIPSLFISYEDGLVLKDAMQQGLVNVTLSHFIDLQPGNYPVLFRATTQCQVIEKTVTLHIDDTPVNLDLNGLVIGENDSECFGATQNITVQDVSVDAGGSLTLIAGNSIIITPGFNVAANGYFHAYISDEYCVLPASLLALESEVENNPALDFNENLSDDLRIFPNPTTGGFTIEMGETFGSNKTSVSIYNLIGELILTNENVLNQAEFNLAGYPNGIYVVLIRNNENTEIRKLIKQ